MRTLPKQQAGFTLIEMIVVMVITGIIGGMIAMFIRAPIQGYADSSRRAEMGDIADTALRRLARDIRTAVPNSIRVATCGAVAQSCVEFLPTVDGGRYRTEAPGNSLVFGTGGTLVFDILGSPITFAVGDRIVIGSTQSDGMPPYNATSTGILRIYSGAAGAQTTVNFAAGPVLPTWAQVEGHRFDVVPASQQAVTYACENANTVNGEGTGRLLRYWAYNINQNQVAPASLGGQNAVLADKISACRMEYAVVNQRLGLLGITLNITRGDETIRLYHAIHVNNMP